MLIKKNKIPGIACRVAASSNNRINSDWQFRCAPLPAGYAPRWRVRRITMIKELPALLEDLCDDLSVLWALDAFKPYQLWSEAKRSSKTVIGKGAAKLPITQRAVRGLPGVQIELPERLPNTQEQTRSLIVASYDRPEKYHSPELQDALTGVRNTVEEIGRAIDLDTALCYRLSEVPGYKTWSPAEFADRQASVKGSSLRLTHVLRCCKNGICQSH